MIYNFTKSSANLNQLTNAIRQSSIVVALDYIEYTQPNLSVHFKGETPLSETDEATLSSIVTNHVPVAEASDPSVVSVVEIPPVAAKRLLNGKNLFRRVIGIRSGQCTPPDENGVLQPTVMEWTVPFAWVKFLGVEFIGAEIGDYADFTVHDTATGTYFNAGAKFQLNKFGFSTNLAKDFYVQRAEFDADLYMGMIIRITLFSISDKSVAVNFIMNEAKD